MNICLNFVARNFFENQISHKIIRKKHVIPIDINVNFKDKSCHFDIQFSNLLKLYQYSENHNIHLWGTICARCKWNTYIF